jgi:hypothetical protein
MTQTYERPRLLVLDILESYAREREIHVVLERVSAQQRWVCTLSSGRGRCAIDRHDGARGDHGRFEAGRRFRPAVVKTPILPLTTVSGSWPALPDTQPDRNSLEELRFPVGRLSRLDRCRDVPRQ